MALVRSLPGSLVKPLASAITGASGGAADAYAANGFSPAYVADFSAASADYFRVSGATSDFETAFTSDSEGGGLATQNDSSGNLVWRPHNLALNSASPATQNITVVSGADYTVEITGSGSVALTGAGTGTVTAGNPVEITASTTTLTLTVTGSPSTMWAYRSDLGGMANNPDAGTTYVATTGAARYLARRRHHRWDGAAWVPTLLHEPVGATNLHDASNDVAGWVFGIGLTSRTNGALDGPYTGALASVVIDAGNSNHLTSDGPFTVTAGATVSWSITISKSSTPSHVMVYQSSSTARAYAVIRISDGVVTEEGVANVVAGAAHIATYVEDQDTDWRVTVVGVLSSGDTAFYGGVAFTNSATPGGLPTFTGNGTDTLYIGLGQIEQSALPTSYIPTTGTAQPRTDDTLKGKAASFPWSTTAVSMAIKGRHNRVSGAAATLLARYEDADDSLELRVDSSNNAEAYAETGGSSQTASGGAVATGADAAFSLAMRYVAGSAIQVATGGTAGSEVTSSVPATPPLSDNDVLILEGSGTGDVNGTVDRVIGWDENIAAAGLEQTSA